MLLYTLLLYLSISMNKNVEIELKTAKLTIYMKNLLKFGGLKMNYRNVYLRKDGRYEGRVFLDTSGSKRKYHAFSAKRMMK